MKLINTDPLRINCGGWGEMHNVKDNENHINNIKDYFKHPWRDTYLQLLIQLFLVLMFFSIKSFSFLKSFNFILT